MNGFATERDATLTLVESERRALSEIAAGVPLTKVLEDIILSVERSSPVELLASVLLLEGTQLLHGAAPSLPQEYCDAIHGSEIGPSVGSCGSAAFRGEAVFVADIATDPLWVDFRDLAMSHGLQACWSTPIKGHDGRVLGTFANYYREPRQPTPADLAAIGVVTQTAALAIERHISEQALREKDARWRDLFDRMSEGFFLAEAIRDDAGRMIDFRFLEVNTAFGELTGIAPADAVGRSVRETVPDSKDEFLQDFARAADGVEAVQFELFAPALSDRWYEVRAHNAGPDRFSVLFLEITARKAAEAALRESEERFRLIAETAPVMIWMGDDKGDCLYLNKALREFWGVADDLSGFSWAATLLKEDHAHLFGGVSAAMARQSAFQAEARYWRADGQVRTLLTRAEPRFDADGRFVGMIGVNVDVTAAREARTHQRLLINELNHRVKNTLATIQSLAHQTLRGDTTVKEAREVLTGRLLSLSTAHDVLTRENWEGAGLTDVLTQAIRPYDDASNPRFALVGPPTRIGPRTALALAMAVHELATNAVKYGALSNGRGLVTIEWTLSEETLDIAWRETGGPAVAAPARSGFGTRLLQQGLAIDLGGAAELDFRPEGLIARISAPRPARETHDLEEDDPLDTAAWPV
jgi:PAS domain S-box-containing protein